MTFPDFIQDFPSLGIPFPADVVQARAVQSSDGLVVFFTFLQDMDLPAHSHGAQWGTVIDGELELTIGDTTAIRRPGDSYDIPSGSMHSARIKAGTRVIDVFAEADRYTLVR